MQNGISDAQLLERFVLQKDEAAFELLLWRHGPMVWGLCRRILPDFHEAEDAFQATMLVLARKAGSINKKCSLASWLYKVAFRIAVRARSDSVRRKVLQKQARQWLTRIFASEPDNGFSDLRPLIDEGLSDLPEKYRAPVVLCYLQNKSNEEAARLLQWPIGTVKTRLAKARELLGHWLRHRGVILSAAGLMSALMVDPSQAMLPAGLLPATLKSAVMVSAGSFGATAVSVRCFLLMEGALQSMLWTKIKIVTALVLLVGLAGSGVSLRSYYSWGAGGDERSSSAPQQGASALSAKKAQALQVDDELRTALEVEKAFSNVKKAEADLEKALFQAFKKQAEELHKKQAPKIPPDPKEPVAFIFDMPITRDQLADYLIAQYGADKLEQLVNKLIIERACREKGITVTDAEIDAAIKEDLKAIACPDKKSFEERILKKFQKSLVEWREDVVKPRLCLNKLARMRVSVSEEDIRQAFEGAYGERVECEIILWPEGKKEEAQSIGAILSSKPEEFERFAREQINCSLAARSGRIDPIGRHTTTDEIFENTAFRLKPGETSIVETKEGTMIVKCIRRIPQEKDVKLDDVRAKLTERVLAKKIQQEIPKLFEELKKQANPRLLLKK
jgi:RNA polymerase sigma factor (sigma-70 family)